MNWKNIALVAVAYLAAKWANNYLHVDRLAA
jgi:hypothetical protein